LKAILQNYLDTLQNQISELETRGLEGTIELQRLTNERRRAIASQYSQECLSAMEKHKQLLLDEAAAEKLLDIEAYYLVVASQCGRASHE
jgi:hypothetical protein